MYRKILRAFLITAVLCSVLTVSAYAESAVVTGSDVNFRSGPGSEYEITNCLPKGTVVSVNDRSNPNWYCVTYNGDTGFMSSAYLSINEENTGAQTGSDGTDLLVIGGSTQTSSAEAKQPTETSPTASPETSSLSGCITGMYVRFRSGPSTDYSILGEYNKGTALTITGETNGWSAVVINGQSGYVCSDYVSKNTPETASAPAASPTPTPAPTEEPVISYTPTVEASGYPTGTIKGNYVRFRSGAGNTYAIYGMYNSGTPLSIIGTSGDWTNVIIEGQTGYVYSSYVLADSGNSGASAPVAETPAVTETVTAASSAAGYICGNNVRFRSKASTSSDILGEYNYGTVLTITGTSGDWKAVTINGKSGFVYGIYVAEGSTTDLGSSSSSSDLGTQIAEYAQQYVGCAYVWGGTSPDGFDCSGFVQYVYNHFNISLKRVACDQATQGTEVSTSDLQPGDVLCFYSSADYIGHVGIYIGNSRFVHASTSTTGVIISELNGYYTTRGFIARRMI